MDNKTTTSSSSKTPSIENPQSHQQKELAAENINNTTKSVLLEQHQQLMAHILLLQNQQFPEDLINSHASYLTQHSLLRRQEQAAAATQLAMSLADNSLSALYQDPRCYAQPFISRQHNPALATDFPHIATGAIGGSISGASLSQDESIRGPIDLVRHSADINHSLLLQQILLRQGNTSNVDTRSSILAAESPVWDPEQESEIHPPPNHYANRGMLGPWSATSAQILSNIDELNTIERTRVTRPKKSVQRKPKDHPKRPLSAYNIFFKEERARMISAISAESVDTASADEDKSKEDKKGATGKRKRASSKNSETGLPSKNGKIGFESLAKTIGRRWKLLDTGRHEYYKSAAAEEMVRYRKEMEVYRVTRRKAAEEEKEAKEVNEPPRVMET